MADSMFRCRQWERRYEGPAGPVNQLVDQLGSERPEPIPYCDPDYGGIEAEVLLHLSDPGPMTQTKNRGSGFISFQNDDDGAARLCQILQEVNLDPGRTLSWNAYPWYVHEDEDLRATHFSAGVDPLHRLLGLLPDLKVIVLFGGNAEAGWKRYRKAHPSPASCYEVLETVHSANRGVTKGSRQSKEVGEADIRRKLRQARELVGPGQERRQWSE